MTSFLFYFQRFFNHSTVRPSSNPHVIAAKVVNSLANGSIEDGGTKDDDSIDADGTKNNDSIDTSATQTDSSLDADGESTRLPSLTVNDFKDPWTLKILSERLPSMVTNFFDDECLFNFNVKWGPEIWIYLDFKCAKRGWVFKWYGFPMRSEPFKIQTTTS